MRHGELISVVMPVYNRAHLIDRVVRSVLAQTYSHLELIVVDDASGDEIESALDALADPRIRLVRRSENGGAAAARNTGIEAARGKWVAFHDSDDYCTADRLELSVRALQDAPPETIGVYGARLIYNEVDEASYARSHAVLIPRANERVLSGDLSARTVQGNIINLPAFMACRDALLEAGGFDPLLRKNEDWDMCLRLTRLGPIAFVPEPVLLTPTSQDPDISAARVSRSARHGASSLARITGKLRRTGAAPAALADHYATAARYLMRIGRPRQARRFFQASLAADATRPKIWAHLALSYLPKLHAKLRGRAEL